MRTARPSMPLFSSLACGLALLLLGGSGRASFAAESPSRPNIILCMADDQGWGDVGYNGHEVLKTPTLDEMAATGLRFDRFYAAAPVCSPTRGSVLTGRHPNRFGCFSWGHTLRPQEVTIAEALKTAGYATGHFGKWHVGPARADSPVSPGNSGFDEWFSSPNFYENDPLMSHNGRVVETEGEGSQVTVDAALKFIRGAADRKQPFLAVVWFGSPHTPHIALPEDREPYKDEPARLQHYYGEITAMDRAVGHLRRELREMKIAENTLLWYTSDNGPQGPEGRPGSSGGLRGRKASLWEGGIRVPTIVEWPARIKSPRTTAVPCGTVDIYPTVLELAGAKVSNQPRPLDGISLVPLLDGRMESRSKPLGFWVYPAKGRPVRSGELLKELAKEQAAQKEPRRAAPDRAERDRADTARLDGLDERKRRDPETELHGHAAWIDGTYKLHRIPGSSGEARYALFDLAKDRQEKENLAGREPERVGRMREQLEGWQKSVIRSLDGEDYDSR